MIESQRDHIRAGLHRVNGLLSWRGVPDNHPVRDHVHQFRDIIAELERSFGDASHEQIDALDAAHDCVSRSMPELLREQSEDELVAREAEILNALLETAKRHMRVWSELQTKIEGSRSKLTATRARGEER